MAMKMISVTDIAGFKLGNAENSEKGTGCTVIVCEEGAVGGVDVRGGGPATRETDLLRSENTVNSVNAVVLSGGSAFGLEAASGVMRELADMKIGFDVGDDIVVPIVCGASLYDLPVGDKAFPDIYMGAQSVRNAFAGVFSKGNHGAGTGATVGKLKGYDRAMKSGLGAFACGDGVVEVGAIAAVNAVGDIYNGAGNIIAGLRSEDGKSIYGTIKTLKGMVHDDAGPKEESALFINKSNIEEALAAAAKQYEEEEAQAETRIPENTVEEPADISEEPVEETAAEFVFEAPEGETSDAPAEELAAEEAPVEEPVEELAAEEAPVEEPVEEIYEEIPSDKILPEEPVEEIIEEPAEPTAEAEESEEEFVPVTPAVIIPDDNYREYAEISIPVVTAEPEIIEEPAEEAVTETAEAEPENEETAEEFVPDTIEDESESVAVPEEAAEEPAEEVAAETDEAEPEVEETAEEFVPDTIEEKSGSVAASEEAAEEPAEEIAAETDEAESEIVEPAEQFITEAHEAQAAFEEVTPEEVVIETPSEDSEAEEVIAKEEEPVALTREDMGYDIVFNTTISCLITNAALTKSQANKLASILHDAYARAIKPVHGTLDGDTVFVLATGKQQVNFDAFAALATDVMQYAIIDGAMSAEGAYGLPAARDMK